jgi:hypothetical protein
MRENHGKASQLTLTTEAITQKLGIWREKLMTSEMDKLSAT